jgi:general secretion pathway protein E
MGVEPFLIGSSLTGVIAQRLVRRLCPDCRTARPADDVEAGMLGIDVGAQQVWHPVGCDACNQLGYRGRFGLYEILVVDDAMRQAISRGDGETELLATQPAGRRNLRHKATDAVLAGETSPEEALRILRGTG